MSPVHRDAGIGKQKSSLAAIPRIVLTEQSEVIESIEVSEDQHIRERAEDWETGYTYTQEYRWEDVGTPSCTVTSRMGGTFVSAMSQFALPED